MGFKLKAFVVVSSGLVLGVCTYAAYRTWKKRLNSADDEGFEDVSKASRFYNFQVNNIQINKVIYVFSWKKRWKKKYWYWVWKDLVNQH